MGEKMNKKLISFIILIIFVMLAIACVDKAIGQNDTFYFIKLGKDILEGGMVSLDRYSWIGGLSYTYPHWLYSIIMYLIYNSFGYGGLWIYSIVLFVIFAVSIYFVNLKINKDKFIALLISLISFPILRGFISTRPMALTGILFLWEVYYIFQLINTGNKKYIIYLVIDSLIIANIHGTTWIMFFVLFLPFIANQIIYQFMKKKKLKNKIDDKIIIEKIDNIKPLLIAFALSLLVGLLTPTRICYTYYFKTIIGPSINHIREHLPLVIIQTPIVFVSLFLLFFSKEKMKLHELFMISGLFLMAFLSHRHLIFLYTVGLLYFSIILMRNVNAKKDQTFSILYHMFIKSKFIIIILLCLSIAIGTISIISNKNKEYISKKSYPVDAVNYIKENLDYQNMKLYNHYNVGSYLLFNDIKVFIDSRCDLYLKEFNPQTNIYNDYLSVDDEYKYEEIFEKYDIEYALAFKTNPLHFILKNDTNYELIHQDDYYALYHRINGE